MQVIHRFVFRNTPEVVALLRQTGRKVNEKDVNDPNSFLVCTASSREPEIIELLRTATRIESVSLKYEKDELMAAKWLIVRPPWQQYSVQNVDYIRHPCPSCDTTAEQVDDIILSANIKKCKRAFLNPAFCNTFLVESSIVSLLRESDLTGFSFRPVYARSKKTLMPTMSQIMIENILPPVLVNREEVYRSPLKCKVCGTCHGALNGSVEFQLCKDVMEQQSHDIYMTSEYFGEIAMNHVFVVSQKFFHFLVANGLRNDIIVDSIVRLV